MTANPEKYLGTKFFYQLIGSHREWLSDFDEAHLHAWDNFFTKDNSEAALCEAATRQLLQESDVNVEPCSLRGNDRSPDFKCQKDSKLFYVDATCLMEDTVTKRAKLDDFPNNRKGSFYSLLTESYFRKADNKETQFVNMNSPCLISIGTLHFQGGVLCFDKKSAEEILTGKSGIGIQISRSTDGPIGQPYNLTSLEAAPFLKVRKIICDEPLIQPVRQTVSAILLCPFRAHPIRCRGILHPKPYYEFDRGLLPDIEFCRLKAEWEGGHFATEWI